MADPNTIDMPMGISLDVPSGPLEMRLVPTKGFPYFVFALVTTPGRGGPRFKHPLTRVGPVRSGSLREFEDEEPK